MDKAQFVAMLAEAERVGKEARSQSVQGFAEHPEFQIVQHENMMDDNSRVVSRSILPELCGFANLHAYPVDKKPNPFIRLFKKYGRKEYRIEDWTGKKELRGYKIGGWSIGKNYYGGFTVTNWDVEGRTQGMVSKERGYNAANKVFSTNGFTLNIESRLD